MLSISFVFYVTYIYVVYIIFIIIMIMSILDNIGMSTMIFGIGTGLFFILNLWAIAILIFLISLRIEKKIGLVFIVIITLFTIILFSIPRASEKPNINERKVCKINYCSFV